MKRILGLFFITFCHYTFGTVYYVRPTGQNNNNGTSPNTAWRDLANINTKSFSAGDIIYLEQGSTYSGKMYFDNADKGTATNPITITSWNPNGAITSRATINSGTESGIYAYNTSGIKISDINIYGNNSPGDGISYYCDLPNNAKLDYILIQNTEIKNFKHGIRIGSWNQNAGFSNVTIKNADVHDNLLGGIVTYAQGRLAHQNLTVTYSKTYNNFGDLNTTTTNTGSGIVISGVDGGNVNHCISYNNGQNNRNNGGGPIGIWCYEANNIVMEYNESYNNKAGKDLDGGGFDIDGGSTNCIMQYNYSHDNEGAGYLFAQYSGATPMNNNICRYNISQNDGRKNGFGGIDIWAASGYSISNTFIYGNTIFISAATSGVPSAVGILPGTVTSNTQIKNNIFITTGGVSVIKANSTSGISLQGNNYWSSGGNFNILWGGTNYSSLTAFRGSGQESGTGYQLDPMLISPNTGPTLGNTDLLTSLTGYQLKPGSPMIDAGVSITNPGTRDFYGNAILFNSKFDIGVHEFRATDTQAPSAPTLSTTGKSSSSVSLSWTGATDNVGVTGYVIYNGSTKVNTSTVTETTFTVTNLNASTAYNFTVRALDAAGNTSAASNTISVTTNATADTQAPTAPTLTITGKTSTSVSLSWSGATDNVGLTGYDVYNGSTKVNTSSVTGTTFTVSNLNASTAYNFTVRVLDVAGNISAASNTVSVTTNATVDIQAPTAPTLSTTGKTSNSVSLSWSGATDNVGVTGYDVYNGSTKVNTAEITGTTYIVGTLNENTAYIFTVKSRDAVGNISVASNTLSVTTSAAQVTCSATGNIYREVWLNINGSAIPEVPKSAPTSSSQISIFESPIDVADNYLSRIRGFVCPPLTGLYTFWIASDDNSELWLSTNENPANKVKIAFANDWTGSRDWIKYPSQKSNPISLNAGQKYYIEALHKEYLGGDNLAVGWELPDGSLERPIPGSRLSPSTHDMQAPTAPTLSTTGKTSTSVSLSWTDAADNVGVAGYDVFDGTTKINTSAVTGTTHTVNNLNSNTTYNFTVKAVDAAGNSSIESNAISVTTYQGIVTNAESNILLDNSVSIYPNPTLGIFNINIHNEDIGMYNLTVFNSIGNKIYTTSIHKNTTHFQIHMNISIVPSGIYYIELHNEQSEIVKKVFKN